MYPSGGEGTNPRGFSVANPSSRPVPESADAMALSATNLGWVEPCDVNRARIFVGQARGSTPAPPRYAFGNSSPSVPLVPGLENGSLWNESKATGVYTSNTVVGWNAPKSGGEQAFYWTSRDGLTDIPVADAKNSRALSIVPRTV